MVVNRNIAVGLGVGAGLLLLAGLMSLADAQPPAVVPCPGGCQCLPNARAFGYFPTRWREWPGEPRPDKTFPQSISAEPVPTPPGRETLPPPKEVIAPEPVGPPVAPVPVNPPAESILPQDREIRIQEGPPQPPLPVPGAENLLPGLPMEPEPAAGQMRPLDSPLPGLDAQPMLPPIEQGLPGLSPQPESPFQLEPMPQNPPGQGQAPRRGPASVVPDPTEGSLLARPDRAPRGPVSAAAVPPKPSPPRTAPEPFRGPSPQILRQEPVARQVTYQESSPPAPAGAQVPRSEPPSAADRLPGLNGYCPVELVENENWAPGDRRWAVMHHGRMYFLSGPQQHQQFLANPTRYCPVLSGMDPVLAIDENRQVPGRTEFCVMCDGRLYMFSGAYSLAKFRQNSKRYTTAVQQMTY